MVERDELGEGGGQPPRPKNETEGRVRERVRRGSRRAAFYHAEGKSRTDENRRSEQDNRVCGNHREATLCGLRSCASKERAREKEERHFMNPVTNGMLQPMGLGDRFVETPRLQGLQL